MRCHLGDFAEYAALRRRLAEREKALRRQGTAEHRDATTDALRALRPGDVIAVPGGRRAGLAVVLDPGVDNGDEPRPLVLTEDRWAGACRRRTSPPRSRRWAGCGCPRTSTTGRPRCAATSRRRCATPASPLRRRRSAAGPGRRAAPPPTTRSSRPAPRAARAPLPRLRRPGGARPVGRAVRPAGARDRAAAAEGPRHHPLAGPRVRPDPRAAGRARLPRTATERHPGGGAAGPVVGRVGPARGRVPAARRLGRPGARRAGRGRVRAGLRVAPRPRAGAPGAHGAGVGGAGRHRAAVGRAGGRRAPAPGRPHPRARPRVRLADAPVGARRVAVRGAHGRGQNGVDLSAGDFVRWCRQVLDLLDQIADVAGRGTPVGQAAATAARSVRRGVVAAGTA